MHILDFGCSLVEAVVSGMGLKNMPFERLKCLKIELSESRCLLRMQKQCKFDVLAGKKIIIKQPRSVELRQLERGQRELETLLCYKGIFQSVVEARRKQSVASSEFTQSFASLTEGASWVAVR